MKGKRLESQFGEEHFVGNEMKVCFAVRGASDPFTIQD